MTLVFSHKHSDSSLGSILGQVSNLCRHLCDLRLSGLCTNALINWVILMSWSVVLGQSQLCCWASTYFLFFFLFTYFSISFLWVHCCSLQTHQTRTSDPITDGYVPPYDWWELNSRPLKEQSAPLTAEPSLQPYIFFKTINAEEMAQLLRRLPALPEVLSSSPNTHVVAHNL